jgi:hypothetical protein
VGQGGARNVRYCCEPAESCSSASSYRREVCENCAVWVITQQVVVIRDKDGTDRLSRNAGKKLPLFTA